MFDITVEGMKKSSSGWYTFSLTYEAPGKGSFVVSNARYYPKEGSIEIPRVNGFKVQVSQKVEAKVKTICKRMLVDVTNGMGGKMKPKPKPKPKKKTNPKKKKKKMTSTHFNTERIERYRKEVR